MIAEIENYFTSSQRIFEYTQLESEDLLVKKTDHPLRMLKQVDGSYKPAPANV
jgi:hypothetical protein